MLTEPAPCARSPTPGLGQRGRPRLSAGREGHSTVRAYKGDAIAFDAWCRAERRQAGDAARLNPLSATSAS